jgi:hypothetical protein
MTEPQNPLFEDEKEFLERKKLEYERALLGDVEHIKAKTTQYGKYALAGAGVAGGAWLISKLFTRKKKTGEADADYKRDKKGKKHPKAPHAPKSAAASAAVFIEAFEGEPNDAHQLAQVQERNARAAQPAATPYQPAPATPEESSPQESFEPDPFEPLAFDDSRRLAISHEFDEPAKTGNKQAPAEPKAPSQFRQKAFSTATTLLQAAMQSETARMLIAQAAAAGLAMLAGHATGKAEAKAETESKNSDLAAPSGVASAGVGANPPVSSAQPAPSDASNQHPLPFAP